MSSSHKCVTCVKCPGQYSPCDLDVLLIPNNIKNMTYEQQCKYLLCSHSKHFRSQAKDLYLSMIKASYNIKRGSCANSFYIKWNTANGNFHINGKSLARYYDHYLGTGNGFRGILRKIIEQAERRSYVKKLRKNGQYCSIGMVRT
jgi:hypothetical protein